MKTSTSDDRRVRPVFAAWVFGSLCLAFGLLGSAVAVQFVRSPSVENALWIVSVAAPIVPLSYFAFRGFFHNRKSAFEALPERFCALMGMSFLALAVLLGLLSGVWPQAFCPVVAAALFAFCITSVREALLFLP